MLLIDTMIGVLFLVHFHAINIENIVGPQFFIDNSVCGKQ